MEQPPPTNASPEEWAEWCRGQREVRGPQESPGLRELLASFDPLKVIGAALLVLVFVVYAVVSESPDSEASEAGMVHSCNRSLLGDSAEVDYRQSDAVRWEENLYRVTLLDGDGVELGDCRVEVTRDTYRVSKWDWAAVGY